MTLCYMKSATYRMSEWAGKMYERGSGAAKYESPIVNV